MLVLHRASAALPAAGAFDDTPSFTPIKKATADSPAGTLSITLNYTADVGATNGYPGFYIAWEVELPNGDTKTIYDTVDIATVTPDNADGPVRQLRARVECESLMDGSDAWDGRVVDVYPGAIGVRIEAAEVGDTANPGTLAIYLGRGV